MDDHLRLRRLDPAYRACFADGSELAVRADREAMAAEIERVCGPADAAAFGRFCHWLTELYRLELPAVHRPQLRLAPRPRPPDRRPGPTGPPRRAAPPRDRRPPALRRPPAAPAVLLPGPLRRAVTLRGPGPVRGDHLHGHGGRRVRRRGRRGRRARPGWRRRRREPGPSCATAARWRRSNANRRGRWPASASSAASGWAADVVVANPDLPVVYRDLLGLRPPARARRGRYSPSCLVWLVGARGELPAGAAHHNIHFGAAWRESFDQLLGEGRPMDDPSILVSVPGRSDPSLSPARRPRPLRARTGAQPRRRPRLVDPAGSGPGPPGRPGGAARLPDRRRGRAAHRPRRLGRPGHGAGHPVRPGPPLLPDRSVPARQRRPGRSRPGAGRVGHGPRRGGADGAAVGATGRPAGGGHRRPTGPPGRAVPARAVSRAGSGGPDRRRRSPGEQPGGELRPLPGPQPAPRHHLLLGGADAAGGQAPPRPCPLRVLPLRRRHGRRPGTCARWRSGPPPSTRFGLPLLRRPRRRLRRRPGAAGRGPHRAGLRPRCRAVPALPALDDDGPRRDRLRHVARPVPATWTARPP